MDKTTTPTIPGSCGNKLKTCMGLLCPEEKRNNCHFHLEWNKTMQQVGVYFGTQDCKYYLPVNE